MTTAPPPVGISLASACWMSTLQIGPIKMLTAATRCYVILWCYLRPLRVPRSAMHEMSVTEASLFKNRTGSYFFFRLLNTHDINKQSCDKGVRYRIVCMFLHVGVIEQEAQTSSRKLHLRCMEVTNQWVMGNAKHYKRSTMTHSLCEYKSYDLTEAFCWYKLCM